MSVSDSTKKSTLFPLILWSSLILLGLSLANFMWFFSIVNEIQAPLRIRQLASHTAIHNPEKPKTQNPLLWDCQQQNLPPKLTLFHPNTRLVFKNCVLRPSIINKTNKTSVDVFQTDKTSWTTEFVFLEKGTNDLEIHFKTKSKHHLQIQREAETPIALNEDL